MIKRNIALMIIGAGVVLSCALVPAQPAAALFQSAKDAACGGINLDDGPATCNAGDSGSRVDRTILLGLTIMSVVGGVLAVIMIVVAGIKFTTSQGDTSAIASAKSTMIYALVGLALVAMAQVLARFVQARIPR